MSAFQSAPLQTKFMLRTAWQVLVSGRVTLRIQQYILGQPPGPSKKFNFLLDFVDFSSISMYFNQFWAFLIWILVWDGRGLIRDVFGSHFAPRKPPRGSILNQKTQFWNLFDVLIFTKIPSPHIWPYLHIHMHIRIHMHMHLHIHIPYMGPAARPPGRPSRAAWGGRGGGGGRAHVRYMYM